MSDAILEPQRFIALSCLQVGIFCAASLISCRPTGDREPSARYFVLTPYFLRTFSTRAIRGPMACEDTTGLRELVFASLRATRIATPILSTRPFAASDIFSVCAILVTSTLWMRAMFRGVRVTPGHGQRRAARIGNGRGDERSIVHSTPVDVKDFACASFAQPPDFTAFIETAPSRTFSLDLSSSLNMTFSAQVHAIYGVEGSAELGGIGPKPQHVVFVFDSRK
jgi:hypothetical protein